MFTDQLSSMMNHLDQRCFQKRNIPREKSMWQMQDPLSLDRNIELCKGNFSHGIWFSHWIVWPHHRLLTQMERGSHDQHGHHRLNIRHTKMAARLLSLFDKIQKTKWNTNMNRRTISQSFVLFVQKYTSFSQTLSILNHFKQVQTIPHTTQQAAMHMVKPKRAHTVATIYA